ncbi:MAG: Rieske (2Fe-2S) protein, partial [Bradymonadaceae bacterium]
MASDSDDDQITRRAFLTALGSCPLVPACEFVEVFDVERGKKAVFDLEDPHFAPLREVGGNSCARVGSVEILLIRTSSKHVRAYNRYCPHRVQDMARCDNNPTPATWDADDRQLTCNWHGSVFAIDGQV